MVTNSWENRIGRTRLYNRDFETRDDVVLWDVMEIKHEQWIKVKFISKNSPYAQGVRLAIDAGKGALEIDGESSQEMLLWYHTAPRELVAKCESEEGLLSIYNVFQEKHYPQSQMYGSGMLIEQDGNKRTYRCHDVSMENVCFDKLVFSIELVDKI